MADDVIPINGTSTPPEGPAKAKRTGWPKGKPRGPKKFVPSSVDTTSADHCAGCAKPLSPLSMDMTAELVRMARDRVIEEGANATLDLLFLASRVDGYCTVGCWKYHGATEAQTQKLEGRKA